MWYTSRVRVFLSMSFRQLLNMLRFGSWRDYKLQPWEKDTFMSVGGVEFYSIYPCLFCFFFFVRYKITFLSSRHFYFYVMTKLSICSHPYLYNYIHFITSLSISLYLFLKDLEKQSYISHLRFYAVVSEFF